MGQRDARHEGPTRFEEKTTPFEGAGGRTSRATTEVGRGGRIVIPAAFREQMGIEEGSDLLLLLDGEELLILTPEAGIRRAQRLVRQWSKGGRSMVDELLEDRRREAAEEEDS